MSKTLSVVFLGVDGSGKSTVIKLITPVLMDSFDLSVYYDHLRPNFFPDLSTLLGKADEKPNINLNPHKQRKTNLLSSLIRFNYYVMDYTIGFYLKRRIKMKPDKNIWIFDRYFYDYLIDQKRLRTKLPRSLITLYSLVIPKPDIVFCLGAEAHKVHKRKPELTLQETERQIKELKQFTRKTKNAVWIDSGGCIDETVNTVLEEIAKYLSKKNE